MRKYCKELKCEYPIRLKGKWFNRIKRYCRMAKQKIIYGFDERDTWDIDIAFYIWIYERIRMYMDITKIDMEASHMSFKYENTNYTMKEYLLILLDKLKEILNSYDYFSNHNRILHKEIMEMLTEILPYLWW